MRLLLALNYVALTIGNISYCGSPYDGVSADNVGQQWTYIHCISRCLNRSIIIHLMPTSVYRSLSR